MIQKQTEQRLRTSEKDQRSICTWFSSRPRLMFVLNLGLQKLRRRYKIVMRAGYEEVRGEYKRVGDVTYLDSKQNQFLEQCVTGIGLQKKPVCLPYNTQNELKGEENKVKE